MRKALQVSLLALLSLAPLAHAHAQTSDDQTKTSKNGHKIQSVHGLGQRSNASAYTPETEITPYTSERPASLAPVTPNADDLSQFKEQFKH
ncbi:hypothetical protein [Brackiella oedipodis]|uniref:hypothetical protein n=1 Tax=Brackiella oedipodis TaxID=124225 RepID=UPI00048D1C05|nr:hypothetical protein [Brackiella oedipodis]